VTEVVDSLKNVVGRWIGVDVWPYLRPATPMVESLMSSITLTAGFTRRSGRDLDST